jgi:hypothetical protein
MVCTKQQGKVGFIGFTGHKNPSIHLKMLSHDFPFDTVQMPLNCFAASLNGFDASFRSFETHVLPEANRRGMAVFGMKSLGGSGEMIRKGGITPQDGLSYAMSLLEPASDSKILIEHLRRFDSGDGGRDNRSPRALAHARPLFMRT